MTQDDPLSYFNTDSDAIVAERVDRAKAKEKAPLSSRQLADRLEAKRKAAVRRRIEELEEMHNDPYSLESLL